MTPQYSDMTFELNEILSHLAVVMILYTISICTSMSPNKRPLPLRKCFCIPCTARRFAEASHLCHWNLRMWEIFGEVSDLGEQSHGTQTMYIYIYNHHRLQDCTGWPWSVDLQLVDDYLHDWSFAYLSASCFEERFHVFVQIVTTQSDVQNSFLKPFNQQTTKNNKHISSHYNSLEHQLPKARWERQMQDYFGEDWDGLTLEPQQNCLKTRARRW